MNIEEIVMRLTEEDKQKIGQSSIWSHLQYEESLSWSDCLHSETHLQALWGKLPKTASQTLAVIISRFGAAPFKEEQLLEAVPTGSVGVNYRLGLLRLLQSGLVFAVRKGWGEKLYFIPKNMFMPWYRIIYSDCICLPIDIDNLNVSNIIPYEHEGYTPTLRLQLLHTMAALKCADMRLTSKGMLTKRTIDCCLKQLKTAYEGKEILKISGELFDGYPFPLAFALEILFSHGLLVQENGRLEIHHGWYNWLCKPIEQREAELVQWIIHTFAFRHAAAGQAAALMIELVPMKWYRLADVEKSLHMIIGDCARAEAAIAASDACIGWLSSFGWLETAQTTRGDKIVRWLIKATIKTHDIYTSNITSAASEPIRITPDGEIFVYPNGSDRVRWLLEMIAERKRTDMVTVYKINFHSLSQAQKEGFSSAGIIELLEEASGERLPETVRLSIEDIMAAEVNQKLELNSKDECLAKSDKQSLFPDPDSLRQFNLLTEWPTFKSLFIGLDDVPVMWVKQLRSYHFTTRKELLERALSWRTSVKLNYKGTVQHFVPERIEESGTEWAVVGHFHAETEAAPIRLTPGMWEEMMLIIPLE